MSDQDSVPSDVDVVGYVPAVGRALIGWSSSGCKAWGRQASDANAKLAELQGTKKNPKKATWRHFRELWVPKWTEAFRSTIAELTGETVFSYRIAVTRLKGDGDAVAVPTLTIGANLAGCSFGFLTLEEDAGHHAGEVDDNSGVERDGSPRGAAPQGCWVDRVRQVATVPVGPAPGSDAAIEEEQVERSMTTDPMLAVDAPAGVVAVGPIRRGAYRGANARRASTWPRGRQWMAP